MSVYLPTSCKHMIMRPFFPAKFISYIVASFNTLPNTLHLGFSPVQKRLKLWPIGSGEKHFASGAVWDSVSEQYYAALETSTGSVDLICWKAESDVSGDGLAGIENRAILPGPIFAIFPGGQFGNLGKISKSEGRMHIREQF